MRIVSLNAWGGRVFAPLMAYLIDVDADVICLQEVVRTPASRADWLMYRDHNIELPQRANLYAEICAALPEHDAFFAPVARGELFDGAQSVPSEFGLATFVRRSKAVIGLTTDFIHGAFLHDGWGPHPRARNAQAVRIFDYKGGAPITIVQLHGLRDPAGKHDTPARLAQADALVGLIGRIWSGNERLVVCGDFNVLPDSATFDKLAELGLADLVVGRGFTDTRTSLYKKPGRYADYMLVTPDVHVTCFEPVAAPEVSDHRALVLDIA
ncbi:endonuclease/exonuclease/phosphatase family protein [Rhizobium sp. KVB221]|uniref:Endonuclease/exonuclease/phosphatase family protein n=1 Tax=Rhizobium setariae TaxID=2801340 RepID=A0A936YQJ7_9HYPH|nr:endonuclease/exonuclease/phosphatase family protein [Rhizobium setariae]MBL0370737.1 endonuclease/exonuclease/phosphatase family protein [Rhizobium setariae]